MLPKRSLSATQLTAQPPQHTRGRAQEQALTLCVCVLPFQAHVVNSSTRWINNTKQNVRTCGTMTTVNIGHGWFPLL